MKAFPRRAGAPIAEPFELPFLLTHLREVGDGGANDAYILHLMSTARELCEKRTERTLISTPWVLTLDTVPDAIELLEPPIIAVQSVQFNDEEGILQTLSPLDYVLDRAREPGFLVPAPGKQWPCPQNGINQVIVSYTAGYGATAASVPLSLRQWMLAAIQQLYDERGTDLADDFANGLIYPDRILGI
jgi:uncharacterized phiE125 gp8 family phage protein